MIIKYIKRSVELSKSGKPYARIMLQFDEYRDVKGNYRWVTGFGNKRTWAWKEGDDVQPEIKEEGKYLNFTFDDTDENKLDVYRLPATIGFVMSLLAPRKHTDINQSATPEPEEEIENKETKPNDIPF